MPTEYTEHTEWIGPKKAQKESIAETRKSGTAETEVLGFALGSGLQARFVWIGPTHAAVCGEKTVSPMNQSNSDPLSGRIRTIRGQRVILDADLARLYGVSTKRFNEAFKRNRRRFPEDFVFQLTRQEFAAMRSQIVTAGA